MKSTQTLMVAAAYNPVSMTFLLVVVIYFLRKTARRVLTLIKKDPRRPPNIPRTIGP